VGERWVGATPVRVRAESVRHRIGPGLLRAGQPAGHVDPRWRNFVGERVVGERVIGACNFSAVAVRVRDEAGWCGLAGRSLGR
jgi:hypothetical protein